MARAVHIGGQTRSILFTEENTLLAMGWLPGNLTVRQALGPYHRDPALVAICIAAALRHQDPKMTPKRVMTWMGAEKARYPEFEAAAVKAAEDFYRERGVIDDEGEDQAPPPAPNPSPTPGTSSSASPVGTASAPATSPANPSPTEG